MDDERAVERVDGRHADALAVAPRPLPAPRRVEHARDRLVDDTGRDLPRLLEPDEDAPARNAPDEVPRAVDGVDDEAPLARALLAMLFTEGPVIGVTLAQHVDDRVFGLAVGLGHRRSIGFERDGKSSPVVLERHR